MFFKGLNGFNLSKTEERVLKFWKENGIFEKSLKKRKGKKNYVFFEGPPTANGRPGTHHVLARVFKDIILRYKTMRGFFVLRRAGWDTQGLPVEIEVEKELGLKNKQDIEKYGVAKFNEKAKGSVWKYKDEWEKLTERIGFWLDFENAYITYENKYLETLWWILKEINKRGFLKKFYKIVPYCPRCQTPLSSHELGQPGAYKLTKDPSVYVKFEIRSANRPSKFKKNTKEYLLVWTTTPWTLPANVAIAVNPKLTYFKYKIKNQKSKIKNNEEFFISANKPPEIEGVVLEKISEVKGKDIVGLEYEPLYKNKGPHKVFAADFVSAEDGTGLVHIAPAFGEDDLNLMKDKIKEKDVPVTVDDRGRVVGNLPGSGKFIKDADKDIILDLESRNLLFYQTTIEHEYPFCWRCSRPLIYFARRSWFIEMSKLQKKLWQSNKTINWIPDYVKEGRFGNWIKEAKDWAISRDRYWGTPLPIWECSGCSEYLVAGGLDDLNKHALNKNKFFIMRHGEASHNLGNGWLSTDKKTDSKSQLTDKGVKQAKAAANLLTKEKINFIYCSPFKRTRQTCEIINKKLKAKVVFDERIKESNFGVFNGKPIAELYKSFPNTKNRFSSAPEGGETWQEIKNRVGKFFKEINIKHKNDNILIISHGDPLWLLEVAVGGLTDNDAIETKIKESLKVGETRVLQAGNRPYNEKGELDLHRPYVDEIELKCAKCGKTMNRVKDVVDVWFDSGAMPFAQWHYPFENKEIIEGKVRQFPADYICEAMDQTRGWFYTLLAIAALLGKKSPYKNVISLGLLVDKYGQKMSKSKGNAVDPWYLCDKYGVDALRWYFYTVNPPGEVKKFNEADVGKTLRKNILILYNSFVFWKTYSYKVSSLKSQVSNLKNVLDKWIVFRLNELISATTGALDEYDIYKAANGIGVFVDDLSHWYIRRSRQRFQLAENSADLKQASSVLQYVLVNISKIIAPFTPFFAEALYQAMGNSGSVHLEDWPKLEAGSRKSEAGVLLKQMAEIRRLASLALAKRAEAGIKVRQPLPKLKIKNLKLKIPKELLAILLDEVNVKEIVFNKNIKEEIELDKTITKELEKEGWVRELTRMVQGLRQDAGLKPKDKIALYLNLPAGIKAAVQESDGFAKLVGAKKLEFKKTEKFDIELENKLADSKIWLAVKKLK